MAQLNYSMWLTLLRSVAKNCTSSITDFAETCTQINLGHWIRFSSICHAFHIWWRALYVQLQSVKDIYIYIYNRTHISVQIKCTMAWIIHAYSPTSTCSGLFSQYIHWLHEKMVHTCEILCTDACHFPIGSARNSCTKEIRQIEFNTTFNAMSVKFNFNWK